MWPVACRTAVPPVLPCGSPEQAERRLDRIEGYVLLCGVNGCNLSGDAGVE
jgi:hypothetical protein